MTDAELSWSATWAGSKVRLAILNGAGPLHVDECTSVGAAESRRRLLERLAERLPAIDAAPIEARLLEMAAQGPPRTDEALAAVDANPEPWAESVDGAELLDDMAALLRRFIVLPAGGAETVALWVLHTYVFDVFEYTPRLLVHSPDMRCGKSRLLRLIAALVSRPLSCENITAPALFRSIERFKPTLLLDEADSFLQGRDASEELRGVVNAGHQRGGKVVRCVGDDAEPAAFNAFAPVAIAMIGRPARTIDDRSVSVPMRRRMPGEQVERQRPGQPLRARLTDYVQRCVRWSADNRDELAQTMPDVPMQVDDRAGDNWFALLAIADHVGRHWPARARQVAVEASASREGSGGVGVQLLADLRDVFAEQGTARLQTQSILRLLAAIEDRPWADYRRGKPINARQTARLLEPFDIRPTKWKDPQGTARGYVAADFADAWARYLSEAAFPHHSSATPPPASNGAASGAIPSATELDAVAAPSATSGVGGGRWRNGGSNGGGTKSCHGSEVAAVAAETPGKAGQDGKGVKA